MVKGERWWENGLQNWRRMCFFKKKRWRRNQSLFELKLFSLVIFKMFYLGLSWLDILLWNVIWYVCLHSFVFPIVKPSSVNSNWVGSLSSEISEMALIAPQILTVLLRILLFVTQESSYYLADRINFVHLTC